MEMKMKKVLSTALAAFALFGAVSAASAHPQNNDIVNDRLAFWYQFGND
jgi:hypothetical protein